MSTDKSPHHAPSEAPEGADDRAAGGGVPLERLRERVERAVMEIERLRAENASLAERVNDLGGDELFQEAEPVQLTLPGLDGDPAALRERVQQFIEAIDRVLAERAAGGSPTPPDTGG